MVTAARCTTPKETLQLIEGAESVVITVVREPLPKTPVSDIDNQMSQLRSVDVSTITDADAARIQAATVNLQRMSRDVNVAAAYARAAETAWATATSTALPAAAERTVRNSITITNPNPDFIADLKKLTKEAITVLECATAIGSSATSRHHRSMLTAGRGQRSSTSPSCRQSRTMGCPRNSP